MSRLFYGTFEETLYAHLTKITKKDLAEILFSSADIDPKTDNAEMKRKNCIDSSLLARFRSGERRVSSTILDKYRSPDAQENVQFWFRVEIIPKIIEFQSEPLVQELLTLIQQDPFIDEEAYAYFLDLSAKIVTGSPKETFCLSDFLAGVYRFAIQQDPCLKRIHNLPAKNRFFYGRENLLSEIECGYKMGIRIQGLFGLAGVGKTQTALQYAQAHAEEYVSICWINAETMLTIEKSIVEFLSMWENINLKKIRNKMRSTFLNYFKDNKRWLIIYDNAEYASETEFLTLKQYFPEDVSKGDILITTRCRNSFEDSHQIEVNTFEPMEAAQFLQYRSKLVDIAKAETVAELLGYHPLALEYAAAYIRETPGVDYASYIKKLDQYGIKVLDRKVGNLTYKDTIREAFHITINKLLEDVNANMETKSIEQFLNICAYLSADEVPMEVFNKFGFVFPEPLSLTLGHELKYDALLRKVTRYSLIQINGRALIVHRLLQEILYDEMSLEDRLKWPMWTYSMFFLLRGTINHPRYRLLKEEPYSINIMIASHLRNILGKYAFDYQNSDTQMPLVYEAISREYANCIGWLIMNHSELNNNKIANNIYQRNSLILQEAVNLYKSTMLKSDIYFAWIVYNLAVTNERLGNNRDILAQYNQAICISDRVMESLTQEDTTQSSFSLDELKTKIPKTEMILAEQIELVASISYRSGMSQVAREHPELMWHSFSILQETVQMLFNRFSNISNYGFLFELHEWLIQFCYQITAYTGRALVLQILTPNISTCKQNIQIRSPTFVFFMPTENAPASISGNSANIFDITLGKMSKSELAMKLNMPWITLAFENTVRSWDDMLNILMNIETKKLSIDAKHTLYATIYALAQRLQYVDIMEQYCEKAEQLDCS